MLTTAGQLTGHPKKDFKIYFAGIMTLGVVCDMAVVYYAKDLKIFDEDDTTKIIQTKL